VSLPQPDSERTNPADHQEPDKTTSTSTRDSDENLRQQLREASGVAFRKVEATAPESVSARLRRFREGLRSRWWLDTTWRILVLALGTTLVAAGLVMFVMPGPGFATVILGLVILGSEFTWATRVLHPVKGAAQRASQAALDPRRRKRNLVLGVIAGVILGLVVGWYLVAYGVTIDPIMSWIEAVMSWFRGIFS
jgi:uncharacterized protein (TIGR02611 family)